MTLYSYGTLVSFDPRTFENVVESDCARLVNVPVVATTVDVLTYEAGDAVLLLGFAGGRHWIAGRTDTPNAGQLAEVVS